MRVAPSRGERAETTWRFSFPALREAISPLSDAASPLSVCCWPHSQPRRVLRRPIQRGSSIGGLTAKERNFVIQVIGQHHSGVLHEILNAIHGEGMDVLECRVESDGDVDVCRALRARDALRRRHG